MQNGYTNELIINEEEFKDYSKGRKWMTVIKFRNFEKFNKTVKLKRIFSISGEHIYENDYKMIDKNRH